MINFKCDVNPNNNSAIGNDIGKSAFSDLLYPVAEKVDLRRSK